MSFLYVAMKLALILAAPGVLLAVLLACVYLAGVYRRPRL